MFFLLVVDIPPSVEPLSQPQTKWADFLSWTERFLQDAKEVEKLTQNVFLIPSSENLSDLIDLGSMLKSKSLRYWVTPLDERPKWKLQEKTKP